MPARSLSDMELKRIADEIGNDAATLGLHLGFSWNRSQAYQNNGPSWSSDGTMQMLYSWRSMQPRRTQRKELVGCLTQAGLTELGERVEDGEFIQAPIPVNHSKWSWLWDSWPVRYILTFGALIGLFLAIHYRFLCLNLLLIPTEIQDLREHLVHYYNSSLCNTTVFPWDSTNFVDYDDVTINLYHIYDYGYGDTLKRRPISPSEVFRLEGDNGRVPRRILLHGAAGAGKRTVTCKIANDWSRCLRGFSIRCKPLLIILQFRLMNPANTLGQEVFEQGLLPMNQQDLITPEMIDNYISHNPEDVIIILLGYDEFVEGSLKDENTNGILDILRVQIFIDTTVIVTTRSWLVPHFDPFIKDYTLLEVIGFTTENVKTYVKRFFQENETKAGELLEWLYGGKVQNDTAEDIEEQTRLCDEYYLNCKIENLSYIVNYPVYLPIICEMWRQDSSIREVHNLNELFQDILEYMYEQYRLGLEEEEADNLLQLDELTFYLGKTAYESLWGQSRSNHYDKTVFSKGEFIGESVFEIASEIGILTSSPRNGILRERHSSRKLYTTEFFHKFIQEYFATLYVIYLQNVASVKKENEWTFTGGSIDISPSVLFLLFHNVISINNKYTDFAFNDKAYEGLGEDIQYGDGLGTGGNTVYA